ncbi:VOC family protein [Kineococcus sp. SYSU DK001]|uniref:VOC family protein n=1 Tax=Kineococcus sp. SYSU DK001 TaxID=3383122 RepID=UPI003D7EC18E
MSITATAHLNFRGNAREALTFYQSVFGGQVMAATYAQVGVPRDSATSERAVFTPVDSSAPDAEHLAFGMLAADNGLRLAAYDVFGAGGGGLAGAGREYSVTRAGGGLTHTESSFLLLNSDTLAEAGELWEKLAVGGTVIQALAPADWAPAYGMLTDRFGVTWIFGIAPAS